MRATRRRRLRLLLRDLAAASAFGAMAISGELPIWAVALFLIGLVIALFDVRILARVPVASGVLLAAGAAALYATVAFGGVDLVVAACSFAALITTHRILSAPAPRTDHQVLLTSLLMISGGAALSGELLFAVFLIGFTALASLSLCLSVLERTLPEGSDFSPSPVLRRMGSGVVFAVVGAMLFFILIPRLSWNVAARRTSRGLGATTGLASGVRLGSGSGTIKTNPRVVARVRLKPDPKQERLDTYWIAATYGTWTGSEWTDARPRRNPRMQVDLREGAREVIHQEIELLPSYGSPLAIAMVEPLRVGNATAHQGNNHLRTRMVEVVGQEIRFADTASSYSYHAYSARPEELLTAPELPPDEALRLTHLPEALDPRVAELASRILGNERDPERAAQKLIAYLKANYTYTLDLPDAPADPLAHFLFERKAGHCEYFATALAVMLRTHNFPARVATGFFGGERIGDDYVVRAGDAHAWTQVFVPDRGFVNVDATPDAGRAAQPSAVFEWVTRLYERIDDLWRGSVLDFSMRDQFGMAFSVIDASRGAPRRMNLPPMGAWVVAATVALAVYVLWRRTLVGRSSPASEATRLRDRAERALASCGVAAEAGEGFEELAQRLWRERHPAAPALRTLVARYVEVRFGGRALRSGEAEELLGALEPAITRADEKKQRAA